MSNKYHYLNEIMDTKLFLNPLKSIILRYSTIDVATYLKTKPHTPAHDTQTPSRIEFKELTLSIQKPN